MGIIDSFEMAPPDGQQGAGVTAVLVPLSTKQPLPPSARVLGHSASLGWSCNLGTWHVLSKWWSGRVGESTRGLTFLPSRVLYLLEAWKGSKSLCRETSM